MSEQAVDVRSMLAVFHRHRRAMAVAAACGMAVGLGVALARPPMYSSTSLVLLPAATQSSSGQAVSLDIETQVRIVGSGVVLGPAAATLTPRMSADALSNKVAVDSPTTNLLRIVASAPSPRLARQASQAVADADVSYLKDAASSLSQAQLSALTNRREDLQKSLESVSNEIRTTQARLDHEDSRSQRGMTDATAMAELTGQQASLVLQIDDVKKQVAEGGQPVNGQAGGVASVIQPAAPAIRPGLAARYALYGGLGLAFALLAMFVVFTVRDRRDRRLRSRDEIADALGTPVIASLRARISHSAAGWTAIMASYSPGAVDAWALRQALRHLVYSGPDPMHRLGRHVDGQIQHPDSVLALTLSEDVKGAAVAVQMASYAASADVDTRLVAAKGHATLAPLFAACSTASDDGVIRSGLNVDTRPETVRPADLTIYLAVVDRRTPDLGELPPTSAMVLVISPGSATAEELARVAMLADDAEIRLDGIVVADPDDLDRTTGRILQQARYQQVPLPTRLTGTGSVPGKGRVTSLRSRT